MHMYVGISVQTVYIIPDICKVFQRSTTATADQSSLLTWSTDSRREDENYPIKAIHYLKQLHNTIRSQSISNIGVSHRQTDINSQEEKRFHPQRQRVSYVHAPNMDRRHRYSGLVPKWLATHLHSSRVRI